MDFIKNQFRFAIDILKKFFRRHRSFIIGLSIFLIVFLSIVFLFEKDSFIDILTFVLVDSMVDNQLLRKVERDKLAQQIKLGNKFNEEYFDLYWTRSIRDIGLFVKCFLIALLVLRQFKLNIFGKILNDICILLGSFISSIVAVLLLSTLAAFISTLIFAFFIKGKFDSVDKLMFKKQQNYTNYSDSEIDILHKE